MPQVGELKQVAKEFDEYFNDSGRPHSNISLPFFEEWVRDNYAGLYDHREEIAKYTKHSVSLISFFTSRKTFQENNQEKIVVEKKEMVNHPSHYGGVDNPYEAIKVIEAWGLGFCLGNTVKYIARAGKKDAVLQELKKAQWYLQREISKLEANDENVEVKA